MTRIPRLSQPDSDFISYLRSLSIFVIVFGHVGGFWVFRPYSEFLQVFVPIFFFISGAVSVSSFNRSVNFLNYYIKRFLGLLIPYYLICVLSLLVYVIVNKNIPNIDLLNILRWIQIRPSNQIMLFPLGQVWFLQTLFIIMIVSPLYFILQKRNELLLLLIMILLIILSGMPLFLEIGDLFSFLGFNLYKPLVHSTFYIFGIYYFTSSRIRNFKITVPLCVFCVFLSTFLLRSLNLNVDYAFHTSPPDLYYVAGSFVAIFITLIFQKYFVLAVQSNRFFEYCFRFFHKHTFSIFLLHTFSIYIVETLGGLVEPEEKTISYGVIKLVFVLIVTCVSSIPFTKLSEIITTFLLKIMIPNIGYADRSPKNQSV